MSNTKTSRRAHRTPEAANRPGKPASGAPRKDYTAIYERYIADVLSGEEMVSRKVRQTIDRHVADLKKSESPDYPYYFDPAAAHRVCRLFERVQPSKWPTKMQMGPWIIACTTMLYGWKMRAPVEVGTDGKGRPIRINPRRFRQAYFSWPRKTGKSAFLSVLGLNALVADGERGAEIYSAALTEDQARRVFDEAVEMRNATPFVSNITKPVGKRLVKALTYFNEQGQKSVFRPLSRDKENMEGLNVHFAACDEVHKWKNRGAWDVLRYGMRSRVQPMIVAITTAPSADDTTSVCNSLETYSEKVLQGVIPDDRFFCWILEIDPELKDAEGNVIAPADQWNDETKWKKCQPNLGVTIKLEDMRQEALEAANDPAALHAFKRYSLNIRVDAAEQVIPTGEWDMCARKGDPAGLRSATLERLKGRICFAGLDLALTDDTSSLVLAFAPTAEEPWEILPYFWIPEENILTRVEKQQIPYDVWRDQGFLRTTPGRVTDHAFIAQEILDLSKQFDVRELAYDPALASGLIKLILDKGFKKDRVVKFSQNPMNYAAPCGDFVRGIARREIVHDGHPVMRWQITNLRWKKNHTGLIMPDKEKSAEKIDGPVAAIMAYGRGTHPDNAKLIKAKPRVVIL